MKNFNDMTVPELLKFIQEQHGVRMPVKTTKAEALAKIQECEGGTPVAAGEAITSESGKRPTHVVLRVHEDNDPNPDVFVGFNGKAYQIKKGVSVRVPYGVYEVLRNAVQKVYENVGSTEGPRQLVERQKHTHSFSVEEKIY